MAESLGRVRGGTLPHCLITMHASVAGVDVAVCQETPQSRD